MAFLTFQSSPVLHAFAASKKHIVTGCMNSDGYDHAGESANYTDA